MTGTFATAGDVVAGGSLTGGADAVVAADGDGVTADPDADGDGDGDGADPDAEGDVVADGGTRMAGPAPGVLERLFRKSSRTMTTTTATTAPRGGSTRRTVASQGSLAR